MLPQLQLRSQLWFGSDPWLENSIFYEVAKKEKKMSTFLMEGKIQKSRLIEINLFIGTSAIQGQIP